MVGEASTLLGENLLWTIGNGNYVWNQKKEYIRKEYSAGCIPLISATSIKTYGFEFPYHGNHLSRNRQYSIVIDKLEPLRFSGPILLIQRTTPRKLGYRIVATIPPNNFYQTYPHFFLENHVNYILPNNLDVNTLYGLLGWINSDLFNYIFYIRNGTNIVSVNELKMMPVNISLLTNLAPFAQRINGHDLVTQKYLIEELNQIVYDYYSLKSVEKQHIKSVLQWKEKVPNGS